jgi:outer membrane protein TolC
MVTSNHIYKARAAVLAAVLLLFLPLHGGAAAQRVLSLQDAIETAMEMSPEIKYSIYRLEGSEANLRAAEAGLKSQFSLSLRPFEYSNRNQFNDLFSTWYRTETKSSSGTFMIRQPIKWTDGTLSLYDELSWQDSYSEYQDERTETFQNRLILRFDQPLFTYNRTKMELEELELDFEVNRLNYALDRLRIEKQVMQNFFDVYEKKMRLEIAGEAYAADSAHYDIINKKVNAGIGMLDDLYQAEVSMMESRSDLRNTEVELSNSIDRLKILIGISLDEEIEVDEDIAYNPVIVDMGFAVEYGLANRLELREREISIIQARNAVTKASATNEFYGDLQLSYGTTGTDEKFGSMYEKPDEEQQLSISFEIPLWDWGKRDNTILASEVQLKSNMQQLDDEKNNIVIEIRAACRKLDNQVAQIEIAGKRVESARRTYEINLEKYQNGSISTKVLSDYRQSLSDAQLSELNALINYRLDLLDLKIKSLWDFENDAPALEI